MQVIQFKKKKKNKQPPQTSQTHTQKKCLKKKTGSKHTAIKLPKEHSEQMLDCVTVCLWEINKVICFSLAVAKTKEGKGRIYLVYTSRSRSIIKGSHGRNSGQKCEWIAYWLALWLLGSSFDSSNQPALVWHHPQWAETCCTTNYHGHAKRLIWSKQFFNWISLFLVTQTAPSDKIN